MWSALGDAYFACERSDAFEAPRVAGIPVDGASPYAQRPIQASAFRDIDFGPVEMLTDEEIASTVDIARHEFHSAIASACSSVQIRYVRSIREHDGSATTAAQQKEEYEREITDNPTSCVHRRLRLHSPAPQ